MIQNTVFVLGAGASCPYGFPSGRQLREEILSDYVADCDAFVRAHPGRDGLKEHHGAQDFVNTFRKSSTKSIDLFLARNPEHSRAGKQAIIFRILHAEYISGFREKAIHRNQDWYTWLFEQMTDKLVRKEDYNRFRENDVSFITFNYDRSLEYFLYDSLLHSFNGIAAEKIIEQLNHIKICHVFGQVGPLGWQGKHYQIEYRRDVNRTNVEALCDNIRIVYEEGENPELHEARDLFSKAHRVFFLGFGVAKENLDILNIPKILNRNQKIYGTGYGLYPEEIKKRIKSTTPLVTSPAGFDNTNIHIEDVDCLKLLRQYL